MNNINTMFKKLINEYYISKKYNIIIIVTYLCIIIGIVLSEYSGAYFQNINDTVNKYGVIITCSVTIIVTLLPMCLKTVYSKKKKEETNDTKNIQRRFAGVYNIENFKDYLEKGLIMNRTIQVNELKILLEKVSADSGCNWIYFTGDSGSGKSTVLKILEDQFGEDALFCNSDYFNLDKTFEGIIKKHYKYVFMDQFETVLKYEDDLKEFYKNLKSQEVSITFIFSFRKEFLVDVEKFFGQMPTYIMQQNDKDKKQMIGIIRNHYKYSEKTDIDKILKAELANLDNKSKVTRTLINAINEGNLPMIAFEIIGTILEQNVNLEDFINENLPNRQLIESVIDFYFKQQIPFDAKDKIVYISILYLLSKDRMLESRFCIDDFKYITFAKEKNIINVLNRLIQNGFIKKVNSEEYEISHDYIAGKALSLISAESVNADIIKSIDYYFHHIHLEKFTIYKNEIKNKLKKRYCYFNNIKNEWLTHMTMFLTCFLSCCLFFYTVQDSSNNLKIYEKIIITLLVGLSVFYVYNFFMNFTKMFIFFWIAELSCIPVISLIFINMNWWILCLGLGVTFIGLSHMFILKPIDKSARRYLRKNFILFTCFGVAISAVGICKIIYQSQGYSEYFWYLFYFLYIMGAIMGHITPDYFTIKIGKANAFKISK